MSSMNYPSPCLTCDSQHCNSGGLKCNDWVKYFLTHWKQIQLKVLKLYHPDPKPESKFFFAHPDEVRRYLTTHPCKGCLVENICDTPCPKYLRWWDARMECARKKVGL